MDWRRVFMNPLNKPGNQFFRIRGKDHVGVDLPIAPGKDLGELIGHPAEACQDTDWLSFLVRDRELVQSADATPEKDDTIRSSYVDDIPFHETHGRETTWEAVLSTY